MKSSLKMNVTKWMFFQNARFHPVSFVTGQVMAFKNQIIIR
ncbi:hypothetical protein [Algoriphagus persicinus]|nr:hypothetical protein [Algoriphagus sp. E1-3-M2]MEB2787342.1 hypothetical protein [Algoriphagus sp. E1-3-M2]